MVRAGENQVLTHSADGTLNLYKYNTTKNSFESVKQHKLDEPGMKLIGVSNGLASLHLPFDKK